MVSGVRQQRYELTWHLGSKMGWAFLVAGPLVIHLGILETSEQGFNAGLLFACVALSVAALGCGTWVSFKRGGFVVDRAKGVATVWVGVGRFRRIQDQAPIASFDRITYGHSSGFAFRHHRGFSHHRGYFLWLRGEDPEQDICLWCFTRKREGREAAEALAERLGLPVSLPQRASQPAGRG